MSDPRIVRPIHPEGYPHAAQLAAHLDADHRFRWMLGGAQGGKTEWGADESGELLFERKPGSTLLVVAPTYNMVRNASMLKFERVWADIITSVNRSLHEITFPNGSRALFRSADDPDSIRGITADVLWGDEVAYWSREAYEVALTRLVATGGPAIFTTTPNRYNFVWKIYTDVSPAREQHAFFRFSSYDNPGSDKALLKIIEENMSEDMARQELYAEFCAPGVGRVFPEFNREQHVLAGLDVNDALPLYCGLDFGYRNPAALLIQVASDGTIYIVREFVERHVGLEELCDAIEAFPHSHRIESIYCDPAGDAANQQTLMSDVRRMEERLDPIAVRFTTRREDRGKEAGEDRLRSRLRWKDGTPRVFVSDKCPHMIQALEMYSFERDKRDGSEGRVGMKDGVHDHPIDAFRYFDTNHFPAGSRDVIGDEIPWVRV